MSYKVDIWHEYLASLEFSMKMFHVGEKLKNRIVVRGDEKEIGHTGSE